MANADGQPQLFQLGPLSSPFRLEFKNGGSASKQPGQAELAVQSMMDLLIKAFGSKTPTDALDAFCSTTLPGHVSLQAIRDVSIHLAFSLSPTIILDEHERIHMVDLADYRPNSRFQMKPNGTDGSISFKGSCVVRLPWRELASVGMAYRFRPQGTAASMLPADESYNVGQLKNPVLCESAVGYLPEALYPTYDDSLSTEASEVLLSIMGAAGLLKIQMLTTFLRQQAPGLLFNPQVQALLQTVVLEGAAISRVVTAVDLSPLYDIVHTLLQMAANSHHSPMSVTATLSVMSTVVQVPKTIEIQAKTSIVNFEGVLSDSRALIERWITIFGQQPGSRSSEEELLLFKLHSFALNCDLQSSAISTAHCDAVRSLSEPLLQTFHFSKDVISALDLAYVASSGFQRPEGSYIFQRGVFFQRGDV